MAHIHLKNNFMFEAHSVEDMSLEDVQDKIEEIEQEILERYDVEPGSTMATFYIEDSDYNDRHDEYMELKNRERELENSRSKSRAVANKRDFYFDSTGKRIYTGTTGRGDLGEAVRYSIRETKHKALKSLLKELYEQENELTKSETTNGSGVVSEIQTMVDGNKFLAGQRVNEEDLIAGGDYVLFASEEAANHIKERHSDPSKPGSTFEASLDLRNVMKNLLSTPPSEDTGAMVKWIAVDQGSPVGGMGVARASQEEVAAMEDYQMPDGRREMVKLKRGGQRQPTSEISLITAKLGALSNGKTALSLVTMFPGGMSVDGVSIPPSRADFAKAGLYFVIPGTTGRGDLGEAVRYSIRETKHISLKQLLKELFEQENASARSQKLFEGTWRQGPGGYTLDRPYAYLDHVGALDPDRQRQRRAPRQASRFEEPQGRLFRAYDAGNQLAATVGKEMSETVRALRDPDNQDEETQNELKDHLRTLILKVPYIKRLSQEIEDMKARQSDAGAPTALEKTKMRKKIAAFEKEKEDAFDRIMRGGGYISNTMFVVEAQYKRLQKLAGLIKD